MVISRLRKKAGRIQKLAALFSLLMSFTILGWQAVLPPPFSDDTVTMNLGLAFGFFALGTALLLATPPSVATSHPRRMLGCLLSLGAATLGFLGMITDLNGMSPFTALNFIVAGTAVLLLFGRTKSSDLASQLLSILSLGIACLVILSLTYKSDRLIELGKLSFWVWIKASVFFALSIGAASMTVHLGPLSVLGSKAFGGFVARRLLLAVFVIFPILGLLRLWGVQQGHFSHETGTTTIILFAILLFSTIVTWTAWRLNDFQNVASSRERLFRYLVEGTRDHAIIMLDLQGQIQSWNRGAERLTGYTEEEAVGRSISILYPEEQQAEQLLKTEIEVATVHGKFEHETPRVRKDGTRFWAHVTTTRMENDSGHLIGFAKVIQDITAARKAQEDREALLRELESKSGLLETVLEQMPAAVIIAEAPSGKILLGNHQVERVWRHPLRQSQDISGYREWIGFHEDGRRYEGQDWPLARAIAKGEVIVNEDTDVIRGDGSRGVIRLSAAPVRSSSGEIVAGVVICEDVTEARRFQAELLHAKEAAEAANHAKSEFLANMSHEIRTPMNAVLGFSDLLLENSLSEDERRDYLRRIRSAGAHLVRIIDDILDLSRVESGRLQIEELRFSILELINEVFEALGTAAESKGLELKLILLTPVPQVIVSDMARLRQVLINLLGNAIKFTDRGRVHVRLQFTSSHDSNNKPFLEIEIDDSGTGIPMESQRNLFQLFGQADSSVTRRYGGTGLGLALSQKLIRALGGDLKLKRSTPGQGSCFCLSVPTGDVSDVVFVNRLERSLHSLTPEGTEKKKPQLASKKILLAEDSPDNIMLMRVYLEGEGAEVDVANDGLEAIALAQSKEYDIILMDLQMPNLGGLEATRRLRREGFAKPILAVTAHALRDEFAKSIDAGCNDHITKPVKRKELIAAILRYSKAHSSQGRGGGSVLHLEEI